MAVYKVPQDVEADDKLLGPFSFRQFIYLIIVSVAGIIAWVLGSLFLPLAVIPLPVILFFGALALPLKKDQPMETYVAALISFYTKPRRRLWEPDGLVSLMEIIESREPEIMRVKNLTQSEAVKRLGYLADIADSEGWSVRNISKPTGSSLKSDVLLEANSAKDTLDESNDLTKTFNQMISQSDTIRKQEAMGRMHQQIDQRPPAAEQPQHEINIDIPERPMQSQSEATRSMTSTNTTAIPQVNTSQNEAVPSYNPYPDMKQTMIQPSDQVQPQQKIDQKPVENTAFDKNAVSPDIINLANNSNLSVETIAHEADRIKKKKEAEDMSEEVVISLH